MNGYGVVYVGTEPSALFRSENGGETWTELKNMKSLLSSYTWAFPPRPFTHHVRWITVDPNNPNTIHVSIEAGAVIQSNDKGHTWIDKNSVLLSMLINYLCTLKHQIVFMHHVVTDLWADLIVLILKVITMETAGSHAVKDLNIIIYTAWQLIQLIAIRFSFQLHRVLIWLITVSLMNLIFIENERYPFQQVQQGLPSAIGTVISMFATNKAEPHTFYTLNNNGVFQSNDSGESWEQLNIPWKDEYKTQHPHALLVTSS